MIYPSLPSVTVAGVSYRVGNWEVAFPVGMLTVFVNLLNRRIGCVGFGLFPANIQTLPISFPFRMAATEKTACGLLWNGRSAMTVAVSDV
jgi:hypothetical protein